MGVSQLECFRATMAHRQHDGFLFYANFTPDLEERIIQDRGVAPSQFRSYFGMFHPVSVAMNPPNTRETLDFTGYFQDMDIPPNSFINQLGVLEIPGSLYHFTRYISPLRNCQSWAELETFPYPNVKGYASSHMAKAVAAAHAEGRVAMTWVGHMYEDAWQIRGYEAFLADMVLQPEWCEFILDQVCLRNEQVAVAAAQAHVDYLVTGDDVANQKAMMFSPDAWRKFMKPRWARVYAAARKIKPDIEIWYHSDGNIWEIIPDLIEIGVTILNPVQPECLDPVAVKREFGKHLVLDGTMGTQTTMPFGTADEVVQTTRERMRTLGGDGALILSPTHVLEPEVPLANIYAFFDTVREWSS